MIRLAGVFGSSIRLRAYVIDTLPLISVVFFPKFRLLRRGDAHSGELYAGGARGEELPGPAKGRVAAGPSPEERS